MRLAVGPDPYGQGMDSETAGTSDSESPAAASGRAGLPDIAGLSDEQLLGALTSWAGRVAAGEAVLLRLLGELDARGTWSTWGALSCAHWAAWKLHLAPGAARERVRVARRLRDLPELTAAMATGSVSYTQVRALTRIATADNETAWLDLARFTTAAQLEKSVRGVLRSRHGTPDRTPAPEPPALTSRYDDDGYLIVTMRFSPEQAPLVLPTLDSARQVEQLDRDALYAALTSQLISADVPAGTSDAPGAPPYARPYTYMEPPYPQLRQRVGLFEERSAGDTAALQAWNVERDARRAKADASLAWQEHLTTHAGAARLPRPRATLIDGAFRALTRPAGLPAVTVRLFVDPVSGWARTLSGELLPPGEASGVLRVAPRSASPLDRGRRTRVATPAQRELLEGLDGHRCRFPSCTRTRGLDAHHVRFWRHGGRTDVANLVLVCARHHTLIHEQGFQLALTSDRALTVRTRDDIPIPHHPRLPIGRGSQLPETPGLANLTTFDRADLGHVVSVMLQHSS